MAFGINMYGTPAARSYADAVEIYNQAIPWQNGGDDRPLPNKRARHMGVRMRGDDVIFRYHRTDVVTWFSDNSFVIDASWGSRSTDAFANHYMPYDFNLTRESRALHVGGWENGKTYPVASEVTVAADRTVLTDAIFQRSIHKRKETRAMLKELGYYEYLTWRNLMYPMVEESMPAMWNRERLTARDALACVSSEQGYHRLMMSASGDPKTIREIACSYYGQQFDIYEVETRETLPSPRVVASGKWLIECK